MRNSCPINTISHYTHFFFSGLRLSC
jgi:hypothetical protein